MQFKIHNMPQLFLAVTLGVSFSYLGIATFDKVIEAQLPLSVYLGTSEQRVYPECPRLVKVEGASGAVIMKDECTNLYWHNLDLPVLTSTGAMQGYTWGEARERCENLAIAPGRGPLFRLPTADELLSLVEIGQGECLNGSCSPITRPNETYWVKNSDGAFTQSTEKLLTTSGGFFQQPNANGIRFAEGAYWTADEMDMDGSTTTYEAAASVNLHYGVVNNPIFGKNVRLNARCIYNKPTSQEIVANQPANFGNLYAKVEVTNYDINELQWSADTTASQTCAAGGQRPRMTLRKNWRPYSNNVNDCPEGVNTELSGNFALCSGVSQSISQCLYFGCSSGQYVQNPDYAPGASSPVACSNL